jgi:hypothetical protein
MCKFFRLAMSATTLRGRRGQEQGPKATVAVRIVSGAPEKRVPSVPGLWRLDLLMDTTEDGPFRPLVILGVQMSHVVRQNRLFARRRYAALRATLKIEPLRRHYSVATILFRKLEDGEPNQTRDGEPSRSDHRRLTVERSPS